MPGTAKAPGRQDHQVVKAPMGRSRSGGQGYQNVKAIRLSEPKVSREPWPQRSQIATYVGKTVWPPWSRSLSAFGTKADGATALRPPLSRRPQQAAGERMLPEGICRQGAYVKK